jgi:hypothetical protein
LLTTATAAAADQAGIDGQHPAAQEIAWRLRGEAAIV